MTIEALAELFREAKAKASHPARIKYPKKLKELPSHSTFPLLKNAFSPIFQQIFSTGLQYSVNSICRNFRD